MLSSNAPRNRLRGGVILLCALAFFAAPPARADEVQEAQKLLKSGQSPQALSRVRGRGREPIAKPAPTTTAAKEAPKEPAKPPVLAQKAPEKKAAAAEKPAGDSTAEVLKTVNGWAQAWSKKDADTYLAYYAKDFKAPRGEGRADWEKARRARIAAPKSISVGVESPKVTML